MERNYNWHSNLFQWGNIQVSIISTRPIGSLKVFLWNTKIWASWFWRATSKSWGPYFPSWMNQFFIILITYVLAENPMYYQWMEIEDWNFTTIPICILCFSFTPSSKLLQEMIINNVLHFSLRLIKMYVRFHWWGKERKSTPLLHHVQYSWIYLCVIICVTF